MGATGGSVSARPWGPLRLAARLDGFESTASAFLDWWYLGRPDLNLGLDHHLARRRRESIRERHDDLTACRAPRPSCMGAARAIEAIEPYNKVAAAKRFTRMNPRPCFRPHGVLRFAGRLGGVLFAAKRSKSLNPLQFEIRTTTLPCPTFDR